MGQIKFDHNEIDLFRNDVTGIPNNFKTHILQGIRLYYNEFDVETGQDKYYEICDFRWNPAINQYETIEFECTRRGVIKNIEKPIIKSHNITSAYDLYEAMGGINSLEYADGLLVPSENSHVVVSNFMNNVNYLKPEAKGKRIRYTQEFFS